MKKPNRIFVWTLIVLFVVFLAACVPAADTVTVKVEVVDQDGNSVQFSNIILPGVDGTDAIGGVAIIQAPSDFEESDLSKVRIESSRHCSYQSVEVYRGENPVRVVFTFQCDEPTTDSN